MAIAQRFNVGGGELSVAKVPKGRLNARVSCKHPCVFSSSLTSVPDGCSAYMRVRDHDFPGALSTSGSERQPSLRDLIWL